MTKLVLTPIKANYNGSFKGLEPQQVLYDFAVGYTMWCEDHGCSYSINDVEDLVSAGVTTLVFNCGGKSVKTTLVYQGRRTTQLRTPRNIADFHDPALVYFTSGVVQVTSGNGLRRQYPGAE